MEMLSRQLSHRSRGEVQTRARDLEATNIVFEAMGLDVIPKGVYVDSKKNKSKNETQGILMYRSWKNRIDYPKGLRNNNQ